MILDPRIGTLNSGQYYAYVNGYGEEPFTGSLVEVEAALGLRKAPLTVKPRPRGGSDYIVTMTLEYPAWDEREGITFYVNARSKSEANALARFQAEKDGHASSGKGRYWFKAKEAK